MNYLGFEFLKSDERAVVITLTMLKLFRLVDFSWWVIIGVITIITIINLMIYRWLNY